MSNCEMTYLILTSKLSRVYVAKNRDRAGPDVK